MRGYEVTGFGELARTLPPALTRGPLATPVVKPPTKAEWLEWLTKAAPRFTPAFAGTRRTV